MLYKRTPVRVSRISLEWYSGRHQRNWFYRLSFPPLLNGLDDLQLMAQPPGSPALGRLSKSTPGTFHQCPWLLDPPQSASRLVFLTEHQSIPVNREIYRQFSLFCWTESRCRARSRSAMPMKTGNCQRKSYTPLLGRGWPAS